jgi:hypothetical protein
MGISSALGSQALLPAGLGFRNLLINGDFRINQRAFTSTTTSDAYGFDRWTIFTGGGLTYSAQTFTAGNAIPGQEPINFARLATSGQSASSSYSIFTQKIESVRTCAGQPVTISFWAKASSGTPKVAIELAQIFGTSGSAAVDTYINQVTLSTSWVRYVVNTIVPSISGKTIGTANDYFGLTLWTSAGSNFNARTGSLGIQNSTIDFWGIQLEQNFQPTPFEQRPIGVELALCQRYYEKSFDYSTAPQNGIYSNSYISNVPYIDYWVLAMQWIEFKVEKRRVPDMSFFGDGGKWQANNSNNTWTTFAQAPTSAVQGVMGVRTSGFGLGIHNNGANGFNVVGYSRMVRGDWVASAEL